MEELLRWIWCYLELQRKDAENAVRKPKTQCGTHSSAASYRNVSPDADSFGAQVGGPRDERRPGDGHSRRGQRSGERPALDPIAINHPAHTSAKANRIKDNRRSDGARALVAALTKSP
ncbi:hypothetical protein GCM10017566_42040 [Amycolatopsis bartoniae]|uniref:Uncharacterized protein n=1 Tax=Amycolatopsis bartoniae TaxID=941986 RepID=A0A8H9IY41_9PSEU|nr:hypothetical protein GCM10017566_42040 [Amycolatopsis bartoniae]